ncbi:MAG: iron-siderophore ABC transporter substrate-binding protein [Cyanobacteria bacterium P01_A01_bin.123]
MTTKMLRLLKHIVLAGLIFVLAIACNSDGPADLPTASEASTSSATRLIKHDLGETEIPVDPQRVVTLTEAWLLAPAITLGIKPIATTTYQASDGIPFRGVTTEQVEGIEILGDGHQPSLEKLLALKPDLILADANLHRQIYNQLSAIAPTVALDLFSKGDSFKDGFRRIAYILDKTERAEQLLDQYQDRVNQFKQVMGNRLDELRISFIAIYGELSTLESFWLAYDVFSDVGLKLIPIQEKMAHSGNAGFSIETLPEHDGDFLFIEKYPSQDVEDILSSPLWQELDAVTSGNYLEVSPQRWQGFCMIFANNILDDLFKYIAENPALENI